MGSSRSCDAATKPIIDLDNSRSWCQEPDPNATQHRGRPQDGRLGMLGSHLNLPLRRGLLARLLINTRLWSITQGASGLSTRFGAQRTLPRSRHRVDPADEIEGDIDEARQSLAKSYVGRPCAAFPRTHGGAVIRQAPSLRPGHPSIVGRASSNLPPLGEAGKGENLTQFQRRLSHFGGRRYIRAMTISAARSRKWRSCR